MLKVKLIGDPIIREQIVELCSGDPPHTKRHCILGASINDISALYDDITSNANENCLFIIHVGTNDVKSIEI